MLIDTHLHLVDRTRLSYPWLEQAPALNADWPYETYAEAAKRLGITGALHMEGDVAPTDIARENAWIGEMMDNDGSLLRGAISSARPEDDGFDAFLDTLDLTIVKGVRRVLHVVPDDLSRSETFRANIRKLGDRGLPFDICMLARQLDIATELVDACEGTEFVLDHCGVPDIAGGSYKEWADAISRLAKRPHVNAKISGISAYATPDWTLDTLRPYVEHVIESFGWDRVVWGSDSPVCTLNASIDRWVKATHALTSGASEDERALLFAFNAARIWDIAL
ncbi:amidohydrolase family protein [Celeribacter sp.]|uniref:amidohydrolase family protein n=1 Tax=Celeribacter sp. TaxID=1890673 RepID=UPI003A905F01